MMNWNVGVKSCKLLTLFYEICCYKSKRNGTKDQLRKSKLRLHILFSGFNENTSQEVKRGCPMVFIFC